MSKVESAKAPEPSLTSTAFALARHYLGGRRGLIVLSVAVLAAAAFFNWSWLVAIGVAPLLLALAPCAAMCALGLCASRMGGKSCSTSSKPDEKKD
jgi:hypothetical protein